MRSLDEVVWSSSRVTRDVGDHWAGNPPRRPHFIAPVGFVLSHTNGREPPGRVERRKSSRKLRPDHRCAAPDGLADALRSGLPTMEAHQAATEITRRFPPHVFQSRQRDKTRQRTKQSNAKPNSSRAVIFYVPTFLRPI
jgi:hypothetical protein